MPATEKKFVIKYVFKDSSNMEDATTYYGEEEKHHNLYWRFSLLKQGDYIFTGLRCENQESVEDYSVKVNYEHRVNSKKKSNEISQKQQIYAKDHKEAWESLMTVKDFEIEEKSIDDSLTVECHVKILETSGVEEMKSRFDESMKKYSDVVLVVDGEKFYVSKMFLASRSPYFDALLMGSFKESNQSEVVLEGIEAEDFNNFLEILYQDTPVRDLTVKSVLHLAEMYNTKCVRRQAEQFLLKESKKSMKQKLELAVKYDLQNVKKSVLSSFNSPDQVLKLLPDDLTQLDHTLLAELFNKYILITTRRSSGFI